MLPTDPTMMHAAINAAGNLMYAVAALVIVFGLLMVAFSFRDSHEK